MMRKVPRLLTEESIDLTKPSHIKYKKISTIVIIVIFVLGFLISLDVLLVSRANIGPFLAIRTKVYNDGGTKVYYGLGYKVIKYHQTVGRRDTVLGTWFLKYNTEPIKITSEDLALEFQNHPKEIYEELYGQYISITGTIAKIDNEQSIITLQYLDLEGGSYHLDIACQMDSSVSLNTLVIGDSVTIVGTFNQYQAKTADRNKMVSFKDCFIIE